MTAPTSSSLAALRLHLVVLLVVAACCGPTSDMVVIGAPHERYDHNRAARIAEWRYEKREAGGERVAKTLALDRPARDEAYTPFGHAAVPGAVGAAASDALPAAHLVPVFVGVPLPLGAAGLEGATSDRDDLIDFLGTGPAAKAGVERKEMQGLLPDETGRRYAAILELLASAPLLASRAQILTWAEAHAVPHSFDILDSRYQPSSFADRVALRQGDFWFVLFMLPDASRPPAAPGYTRLVVAPAGPLRSSPDKGPGS